MNMVALKNPTADLANYGLHNLTNIYWNLSPATLVEHSITKGQGRITNTGALAIQTGEFRGRTPKDRFVVKDANTEHSIDWGAVNQAFDAAQYDSLYQKVCAYMEGKELYVRDAYACADDAYRLNIRVMTEYPWSNQFASNMFLRPTKEEVLHFQPDWTILCAPGFKAIAAEDGTNRGNFVIVNFTQKQVLIGGTGYTGEIKKSIFSILNYILPYERGVLSMHCSANASKDSGDTAVFFGLSGTGKTTLSADPKRLLIGDDEHGWSENGIFNFEGGCYAKTINITEENEPEIYRAIKHGAILENIGWDEQTGEVDYTDTSLTENTRVSYPLEHIPNALMPSLAGHPNNIFFLTCDAYGILPPISRLTKGQAMYHFISGYTAKVAGTEEGIVSPTTTFSACFGAPFLPLHPTKYAEMLGQKMEQHDVNVWLINTGWSGGGYGVGSRMKLRYTRAMITAALEGKLDNVPYETHEIFGVAIPTKCPIVPDGLLNPRDTWENKYAYDSKANELAEAFVQNFSKYADKANAEILAAAPRPSVTA